MQVLKDEIKNNILTSARFIFMEIGYEKATMRAIAGNTGITVGNLYRYYKNKAAIYEAIVKPAFSHTISMIESLDDFDIVGFSKFENEIVEGVGKLHEKYHDELIVLLNGASGTKYENTIDMIKQIVVDRVVGMKESSGKYPLAKIDMKYNIELVSGAFIDTVVRVLLDQEDSKSFIYWVSIVSNFFFKDIQERVIIAHKIYLK